VIDFNMDRAFSFPAKRDLRMTKRNSGKARTAVRGWLCGKGGLRMGR
jgi:hypothetical protein